MSLGVFGPALFMLILFGPMLVTGLFAGRALCLGSYRRQRARDVMVFLKPVSLMVFLVTVALNLLAMCALIDDKTLFDVFLNPRYALANPAIVRGVLAFGGISTLLYYLSIRWYVKTCPLVLNLERRTYRTLDMTGVKLKPRSGPWDDIAGICVKRTSAKGGTMYYVQVRWRVQAKLTSTLGGFSQSGQAEVFAAQMARELGLTLVPSLD